MSQILITGCGRSGTEYISHVAQKLGLDLPHERVGADGIVDWAFAGNSDQASKRHKIDFEDFDVVLHQVRDPMRVMCSVSTFSKQSWHVIFANSPVQENKHPIVRAAEYWYYWNLQAQRIAHWTYRIESLEQVFSVFCAKLGLKPNRDILKTVPTDVNSRSKPGDRLHNRYQMFSWDDLFVCAPQLAGNVMALAVSYGYEYDVLRAED